MSALVAHRTLCALTSPFTMDDVAMEEMGQGDWDELIAVANRHYLVPALYCGLLQSGQLERMPAQAREYATAVYELNVERNKKLLVQLERVTRLLNEAGIKPVLMKGAAALVEQWMPDPGSRFMFDLDLLVTNGEAERAFALLCEAGYAIPENKAGAPVGHHYPPLQKEGEPALLELHVRPLSKKCAAVIDNQTIMQGATLRAFGTSPQVKAWLPSPTEQALLFFLHSEVSHENHATGMFDIRHAWDLPWFARHHGTDIDWGEIKRRAEKAGYDRELASYLYLLQGFFALANPYGEESVSREAKKHYEWVSRKIARGASSYEPALLALRQLRMAFTSKTICMRYGDGNGWHVNYYRLYHLFFLLRKYRHLHQFSRLFHGFHLRIRDNAGR